MESWRTLDSLDSKQYHTLLNAIGDITTETRNLSRSFVNDLIKFAELT